MAKKVGILLVVAFAAFYLLTQPAQAADAVQGAVGLVGDAFGQIQAFLSALFD